MPQFGGGMCVPQVFCKRLDPTDSEVFFTDDVIFSPSAGRGLFQLLVYLKCMSELPNAKATLQGIDELSLGEFKADDAIYLVEDEPKNFPANDKEDYSSVFQIASGDDFAASPLCKGRPPPYFYNPKRLGKEIGGNRFTIIRPDRFLFAACSSEKDLEHVVRNAAAYLRG